MKENIKSRLPVSKALLEKKSDAIVAEIQHDMHNELKKELIKELKKELKTIKETNIQMNSNTNVHIEEVKKQLVNSLETKMEYTKKRFESTNSDIKSIDGKLNKIIDGLSKLNDIYRLEESIHKQLIEQDKKIDKQLDKMNQKIDRIEKLLEMNQYGITKEKREKQIVVSFTSYGKRISKVPLVLDRIFNQTLKPDRVVLYLSKENFPGMDEDLPERLLEMRQYGLEIRWCEGDIKSYKKIIPALKEFPEDIIITIDDDLYYDLDMIEKLYDSYKKYPKAISALRVHKMKFDEHKNLLSYNEWDSKSSEILGEESMLLFATGVGGILYPPHALSEEVLNEEVFMELCPNADDVWLKFMGVLNNTPVVLAAEYPGVEYYVEGTQEDSLWRSNVTENDGQITRVIEKYNAFYENETLLERINK